jgi:hypothetical protein
MFDAIQIQIHIQFRPMKMMAMGKFHSEQLLYRRLAKPRKIIEARKILKGSVLGIEDFAFFTVLSRLLVPAPIHLF